MAWREATREGLVDLYSIAYPKALDREALIVTVELKPKQPGRNSVSFDLDRIAHSWAVTPSKMCENLAFLIDGELYAGRIYFGPLSINR